MKVRELPPGSPEAKRRDELLAIMNDETRSDEERDAAAKAAAPLCHERPKAAMRAGALEGSDRTAS
jgi:predicted nuclease with RNAse H fold